jgi:NADPH:quinone reductase
VATVQEIRYRTADEERLARENFALVSRPPDPLRDGTVRVAITHLSLDPYVRLLLRTLAPEGSVRGQALGRVVETASSAFSVGDIVSGELVWATEAVTEADRLTRVVPHPEIPLHHYVGLLGLSGITAYFGMQAVCNPQQGQDIVVSGAYGGVGQVAIQIARLHGARVLGIVGSQEKQERVRALGGDAILYTDPNWGSELRAWTDAGIDTYFDNVWGSVSEVVIPEIRERGLIAICGQISGYERGRIPPLDIDWYLLLTRSLTMRGFRAIDYLSRYQEARDELASWFLAGDLRQDVDLFAGLEAVPDAFVSVLNSGTVGKAIVAIA